MRSRLVTSTPSTRHAFTLLESVIALVVVSVVLIAALQTVGATARVRQTADRKAVGPMLAQDLMAEVLRQRYEDPDTDLEAGFGPELGEATGTREGFDDVDDYAAWVSSPPRERDGTPMPEYAGWERRVLVAWADASDPRQKSLTKTNVKLIEVEVRHEGATVTTLSAVRSFGWPVPSSGGPVLLLVVADADNPTAQEGTRKIFIEGWGYAVTMISASDSEGSFATAAADADVAYVVEQQQSTVLGTKLRNQEIGVVVEEAELRADFGFSANRDWPLPVNHVDLIDNTHYITSPFAAGDLVIATKGVEVVSLAGNTAPDLMVLGEHNDSSGAGTQPGLSVIETGGRLYGGGVAPARRVQMPWGRTGFDVKYLTDDGWTLMKRAIDWAAEREAP